MSFKEQSIIKGEDPKGKFQNGQLTQGKRLITDEFETRELLKEVVKLLKINNQILNEVHDLTVNETDIQHG